MEEVGKKYANMLEFVLKIDDKNEWIVWLQTVPLEQFIFTIRTKLHLTVEENYRDIIVTSKIDESKISGSDSLKLRRYIEYFREIAKLCKK